MKELRIGLIGCGAIGREHVRRINTKILGARVAAVSDISEEGGRRVAEQWNAAFMRNGFDLITSRDVDAVVITSLDDTHEAFVLECIRAGKPVFCEKPLAPDESGCRRIVEAEMAGGRQLVQVGFMRRYDPAYRTLKGTLDDREYGEPLMLHCAHRNGVLVEGFTTPMLISNCLTHEIDVLRWLLGERYAACQVILPKKSGLTPDFLHDPQILLLKTESGVHIDVEVFVNCQYGYDIRTEAVCEKGSVSLPLPSGPLALYNGARRLPVTESWINRFTTAYDIELQEWVTASLAGRVDGPSAWDGYLCTATASICGKARETGEILPIPKWERPDFYGRE